VAQPRTPVSGTTSDARIMARLEFRYGDMTQPRSTCPVMRSGDGRRPVLGQRTAFGRGTGSVI